MPLLGEKDANYLRKTFSEQLLSNVKLLVFVDDPSVCEYCDPTQQILEELAELGEKIGTTVYNVKTDKATAEMYKVEMTPAIVILNDSGKDTGIRFYGIPSGHEFSSLIQDIIMVSSGNVSFFNEDLSKKIRSINTPVKIRVFVTLRPTSEDGKIAHDIYNEYSRYISSGVLGKFYLIKNERTAACNEFPSTCSGLSLSMAAESNFEG